MRRCFWLVILLAGVALVPAKPARAFVLSASLGGGDDVSESSSGFFTVELNAGLRIPIDWWRGEFWFSPEAGWSLDLAGSQRHQLHVGIALSYNIIDDILTLSYKPSFLTNFDDMGLRNSLRIGLLCDVFPLELQHDAIFTGQGTIHAARAILGFDFAAAYFFLLRMAR